MTADPPLSASRTSPPQGGRGSAKWKRALLAFRGRVEAAYGERLAGVYLYGSRARGEAGADSDADVAVLLRDLDFWRDLYALTDIAFPSMAEFDLLIHARPVDEAEWRSTTDDGSFIAEIRKDAVPVDERFAVAA
jgi:uncharacterized protein